MDSSFEKALNYDAELQYDVALSFAGENRALVDNVAIGLRRRRVKVFYDDFEKVNLWGKNLYEHFHEIFSSKAKYFIPFLSQHYFKKAWPRHELRSAQAKQLESNREYILPVRLDDTPLPQWLKMIGYIDAQKMAPQEIVDLIMEKLGRKTASLFRGMDLGHDIDPLRSSLVRMDPSLFEEICAEVLTCFQYRTAHEEDLASSVLSRNKKIGEGWIRTGVFFDAFTYARQLFTEIGFGPDEDVSRILGEETYFSEGGTVEELRGPAVVVVHSCVENVPASEDILAFGEKLKNTPITHAIFFINESVWRSSCWGVGAAERPLGQLGLHPVPLFLEDLAYQVLTTEVYQKYESQLKWAYQSHL